MTYQHVTYEVAAGIATLTFNRPEQLNAMNRRMMGEIVDALGRLVMDDAVKVSVITGNGRAFMAGADIKEYAQQRQEEFDAFQELGHQVYTLIESSPAPVIAALNGMAFGGGFEIALACDLLVAMEGVKCGLPEINLGLVPGGGGTQRLPHRVGLSRANELLMTGRAATVEELRDWGLINAIYPSASFGSEVRGFALQLAAKGQEPLRALKRLTRRAVGNAVDAALAEERAILGGLYQTRDAQAEIQRFYQQSLERARARHAAAPAQRGGGAST